MKQKLEETHQNVKRINFKIHQGEKYHRWKGDALPSFSGYTLL